MSYGEEQQKEIETIRERKITVKLTDADCDRLARKCGEHGLTTITDTSGATMNLSYTQMKGVHEDVPEK